METSQGRRGSRNRLGGPVQHRTWPDDAARSRRRAAMSMSAARVARRGVHRAMPARTGRDLSVGALIEGAYAVVFEAPDSPRSHLLLDDFSCRLNSILPERWRRPIWIRSHSGPPPLDHSRAIPECSRAGVLTVMTASQRRCNPVPDHHGLPVK